MLVESSRRVLQIVRGAFLASIVIYAWMVRTLPSNVPADPRLFRIITAVAVAEVLVMFVLRRVFVVKAEEVLVSQPEDAIALQRWRTGYLVTWCLSEAVALFGVVLHFLGFTFKQVLPFFIAGFALIVFSTPRRIEQTH